MGTIVKAATGTRTNEAKRVRSQTRVGIEKQSNRGIENRNQAEKYSPSLRLDTDQCREAFVGAGNYFLKVKSRLIVARADS